MPVTCGRIAVYFDQGIGDVMDDEFDSAEAFKQRLDLCAALGITGVRRAIPYSVLYEHVGHRIGIGMCWTLPAAVVIVYVSCLELDHLFAILERSEPLFDALAHAAAPECHATNVRQRARSKT